MSTAYRRTRFEARLHDTCQIEAPGLPIANGKGGQNPGAPTLHSYPCTVRPSRGTIEQGDRVLARGSLTVRLPAAALAQEGWACIHGGRRYRIVWAPPVGADSYTRQIGLDL